MLLPPTRNLRVLFVATDDQPRLVRALHAPQTARRATVLKDDKRCTVLRSDPAGQPPIVIKTWRLSRPRDLANRFLHRTQALRHAHAVSTLARLNIDCAPALLVIRGRDGANRRIHETLVMPLVPGRSLLHHLADAHKGESPLSRAQTRALADAAGALIHTLASNNLFNRDGKPSNIMVAPWTGSGDAAPITANGQGEQRRPTADTRNNHPINNNNHDNNDDKTPRLTVIDAVGLRAASPREAIERMLLNLLLEPIACGCPPSPSHRAHALRAATPGWSHAERRALRARIEKRLRKRGPITPRIDPLTAS